MILNCTQNSCEYNINKKYPLLKKEDLLREKLEENLSKYEQKYGLNPELIKINILKKYFTDEAFEKLKDIPVVSGSKLGDYQAYAAGRNCFINFIQFLIGYGWGRKTIIIGEYVTKETIIHEYVHHASAIGLLNDDDFSEVWDIMEKDEKYKNLTQSIEEIIDRHYNSTFMTLIPLLRTLERESLLAEKTMINPEAIPDYVKKIYSKTLKYE